MSRRILPLAVLLAGGLLLSACATPVGTVGSEPSGSSSPSPSPSASDDDTAETEVDAAWLDAGRMIGVVTYGSSTCIPRAEEVAMVDGVLEVELRDDPAAACTRDLAPRASVVALPEGVDPTQDLEIRVTGGYSGDTDLDGLDAAPSGTTEFLPSAGWVEDGMFVVLTWGSSSCVPELASVEATGPAEVTATFATPPADQVCTMDMAPRALVATVEGVDDDEAVLVLTGGEFLEVRTPILPS
ncbi:hypothetical protein [Microbacterium hominis]|uniref:Lipoprotein n=1 Tax=Microbacterium hominis TaxID=162426 RepID=A0A7D4TPH4_9MICO|nr:hypothetical protein [Microbacterium hominis]QKJ18224.1 hypothetical protein HQM25_01615 [Microbacterium hominis]